MNVILGKTMKRAFFVLICFPLFGSMAMAEKNGVKFNDLGITLYGKFNFESEGEMFVVENTADRKQLVPAGAVLTCIRSAYTIGYFEGGTKVTVEGKSRELPKVFFMLKPTGEITFHEPSQDGNFPGTKLAGTFEFGAIYKVKNGAETKPANPDKPVN